jgi:hypothetical protein
MRAIGNELYRSAIVDGQCAGVSLVVHGEHEGLRIEGNLVREDVGAAGGGCWGIAVDTGYAAPEGFRNLVIRGNRVINVGNMSIGINACQNCLIENNVVVQTQDTGHTAIAVPDRQPEADDLPMTNVTVRNNSIYSGDKTSGTGIKLGGEGTDHTLVSNAVYYAGADQWSCFELDLALSAYEAVDNNLCFFPSASGGEWVKGAGDLSAWQGSSGFDSNSLVDDPGYTAVDQPDYDLSAASSASNMVDRGHQSLSAPTDITGADRDSSPDTGAYEWLGWGPASPVTPRDPSGI